MREIIKRNQLERENEIKMVKKHMKLTSPKKHIKNTSACGAIFTEN